MNRIDSKFEMLKKQGQKAMIAFVTAGDPGLDETIEFVYAMEESGADIVELGIPYSDPLADGPVIQSSSLRALKAGAKIDNIMDTAAKIRDKSSIPLVYLVYYNSVFKYGVRKFIEKTSISGVDGLIIPDLPIEERAEIMKIADKYDVCLIPLVAPTSKDRIKAITQNGSGFVYCVSTAGVTGVRNHIDTDIKGYMETVSEYTSLPKALGFGISGPEMAEKFKPYCEGIIVGSAIVKRIAEAEDKKQAVLNIKSFVSSIKNVLKK